MLRADAERAGDGGSVVLWSDKQTAFAGQILARGGVEGGNGGSAEVSGKALLSFTGQVDLSAPAGSFGSLLLDPFDLYIEDGDTNGVRDTDFLEPFAENSVLNSAELVEALNNANVIVLTRGDDDEADQAGNITVGASINWGSDDGEGTSGTLTLDAAGDIIIGQPITAPNGGLTLLARGFDSAGTRYDHHARYLD